MKRCPRRKLLRLIRVVRLTIEVAEEHNRTLGITDPIDVESERVILALATKALEHLDAGENDAMLAIAKRLLENGRRLGEQDWGL